MSINALGVVVTNSAQQINHEGVPKAAGSKTPVVHQPASEDTTSFTSDKATVQTLQRAAIEPLPSRQTRVEALKQAVHSAQYQLDNAKIAASLVDAVI